jgi:peptidoglycan L-alanyl-D-glutamate endopeptidase CwlK
MAQFDARSEKNIKTLVPKAQEKAREFLQAVRDAGINAKIIDGSRTYKEQDALFAIGRTKPGHIVTKARGGFSNHNFGIAWDIGIFEGAKFITESALYDKAGSIGKGQGLEWGGDFNSIIDKPHFQCKTGKTLAQLRKLKADGKDIPVLD